MHKVTEYFRVQAPAFPQQTLLSRALASWLISLLCLSGSSLSLAQDPDDSLALLYGNEETVSIATGTKKPLRLAPSVASVITAEDIKAMGTQSLDEALQAVAGLHVSLSPRYSSLISIRGIHTNWNPQVLLLIDGFPVTELFTGGRIPTFRLPVQHIQRIEIIRGPGSAIYGADAFAGAINVITKGPAEMPDFQAGAGIGSFDTHNAWLQLSTAWAGWDLGFTLEKVSSNGDRDRIIERDLQSSLDTVYGSNASLAPGAAATDYDILNTQLRVSREHWSLGLSSWKQDEAGIGAGVSETLDAHGYQDANQHLLGVSYSTEELFQNWRLDGHFNYFYSEQESRYFLFPKGAILPIGTDGNIDFMSPEGLVAFPEGLVATPGGHDEHQAIELVAFYNGLTDHRVRMAAGYKAQREEVVESKNFGPGVIDGKISVVDGALTDVSNTPFSYVPNKKRDIKHISIQDEWSLYPDWELTAGLRYDDYSDFGDTINPRLALVWQTNYQLASKLLYGRAFRAPSFSEQFVINNPVILGNPDVDPEQIDTVELSFEYRPSYDLNTRLNLFSYDIRGLIDYVDDDGMLGGSSTAQNVLDQKGHGFELEASWDASESLYLAGNYSWQHSENKATGRAIADAPQQLLHLDGRWRVRPAWTLSAQLHHVAERSRSAGDIREDVADYTLVNLNIYSDRLTSFVDFRFSIHNLFGKDAREPSVGPVAAIPGDHPLEGRRYMLEAFFRMPR